MRLLSVFLDNYLSVTKVEFEAGPFTVLFGKNSTGKSNILEALYGLFSYADTRVIRARDVIPGYGRTVPIGVVRVELERGLEFDATVLDDMNPVSGESGPHGVAFVPPGYFGPANEYMAGISGSFGSLDDRAFGGLPTVDGSALRVMFLDWEFKDLYDRVEAAVASLCSGELDSYEWVWLERTDAAAESLDSREYTWRLRPQVTEKVEQLSWLATGLLPDFLDGVVLATVADPEEWGHHPKVSLNYGERNGEIVPVDMVGRGAARWIAAAVQLALHLMEEHSDLLTLRGREQDFSGHVLLVDEPEAHLHSSAVASVVRWCHRMVDHGFTVLAASHHEEFLRSSGDITLVHVTREHGQGTRARTLAAATTPDLLELASDMGMHPASALSLHRAILFVEGTLDEAVLDEYGGPELDAAGVKIIPIHGTKNIEGIVDSEVLAELGIKMGILTDATDPATMAQRSGRKRSSEERKVIKVLERASEKGLAEPAVFGVPEDDLLFALPAEAVREHLQGPFPGWDELRAECRAHLGAGPSDSVDWKSYARERYGLSITEPFGVRHLVRALDLANVPMPSIRRVIDDVIAWAVKTDN